MDAAQSELNYCECGQSCLQHLWRQAVQWDPSQAPDGHSAVGVLAGRWRRGIISPDCRVTKCHNLSLTSRLQAMREKMGKRNKRKEDERRRGLIWSARGGNKHVWTLPGRQPIHQGDLEKKAEAFGGIWYLDPLLGWLHRTRQFLQRVTKIKEEAWNWNMIWTLDTGL